MNSGRACLWLGCWIGLITSCASWIPISSRPAYTSPPKTPEPPKQLLLTEAQRLLLEQKVLQFHADQVLSADIAFSRTSSAVEAFHVSHVIAQYLFDHDEFSACADFIAWVQQALFRPPAAHTFQLLKALTTYRVTWDLAELKGNLHPSQLALEHTPFEETYLLLGMGLPVLARSNNTRLALSILDQIFAVYGSAEIIFEKIEEATLYSPLKSDLVQANHQRYSSPALAGLIYAEQIFAAYDQLQFAEVTRQGSAFLTLFPQHRLTSKIAEVVARAGQKTTTGHGFKIALLLPLTGPYAHSGNDILEGIFHTTHLFEPDSSTPNRLITFFPIDTHQHQSTLAETTEQLMARENIFLMIGPYLAQNHRALEPVIEKHRIPLLSLAPIEQGSVVLDPDFPVLNLRPALGYQLKFMMDYLSHTLQPIHHVAVLYPNNGFGAFHAMAAQRAADLAQKPLREAEVYETGAEKTYRDAVERLLGLFDLQDRKEERETLAQDYELKNGRPPPPNQLTLPPVLDFELLYLPSPLRDASVLVPLFKYFEAQRLLILGSAAWNHPDMILRTRPFLGNVILFDTFYDFETDPRYRAVDQDFKQTYNKSFNRNHFLGKLVAEVLLKTLSRLEHPEAGAREEFLEQIQQVGGRTFFGQTWQMTPAGSLHLDPIPLAFHSKSFLKLNEEMIAKIRENVFPIKVLEEPADTVESAGNWMSSQKK